jgi:hypothetical protein
MTVLGLSYDRNNNEKQIYRGGMHSKKGFGKTTGE